MCLDAMQTWVTDIETLQNLLFSTVNTLRKLKHFKHPLVYIDIHRYNVINAFLLISCKRNIEIVNMIVHN